MAAAACQHALTAPTSCSTIARYRSSRSSSGNLSGSVRLACGRRAVAVVGRRRPARRARARNWEDPDRLLEREAAAVVGAVVNQLGALRVPALRLRRRGRQYAPRAPAPHARGCEDADYEQCDAQPLRLQCGGERAEARAANALDRARSTPRVRRVGDEHAKRAEQLLSGREPIVRCFARADGTARPLRLMVPSGGWKPAWLVLRIHHRSASSCWNGSSRQTNRPSARIQDRRGSSVLSGDMLVCRRRVPPW
jgi:hypothetical protein